MHGGDLILGCAAGYGRAQVDPFLRSLAAAGFDGELCLLVHGVDALGEPRERWPFRLHLHVVERRLRRFSPSFLYRRFHGPKLRRLHERHVDWVRRLPIGARAQSIWIGRIGRMFLHIGCSRYSYYQVWLERRRRGFRRVLLTDVRDVVFQDDPFRYGLPGDLVLFLEHPSYVYGDENPDTVWARLTYGEEYVARVRGCRVSCCGTVMGGVEAVRDYLAKMVVAMAEASPRMMGTMLDQVVHNNLILTGQLPGAVQLENWEGAVLTLATERLSEEALPADRVLRDRRGAPVPVLHQYDRYPALVELWAGGTGTPEARARGGEGWEGRA